MNDSTIKLLMPIPAEQSKWLYSVFLALKKIEGFDESDYFDPETFANYLSLKSNIRLDDYQGNSHDFYEDCYLGLTWDSHEQRLGLLLYSCLQSFHKLAAEKEYFELAYNTQIMLEYMQRAIDHHVLELIQPRPKTDLF